MSVIIKGMEMPTTCTMCDLAHAMKTSDGSVRLACGVKGKWQDTYRHRPAWCPMVEIPEKHGRLIDADIAYDKIAEQEGGYYLDMDGVDMGLQETPIILEAEDAQCDTK